MKRRVIIDRRPEQELEINEVKFFLIDFRDGDLAEKINKREMRVRIGEQLTTEEIEGDKKINVRYSKNYCETQRKGASEGVNYVEDRDWQSWNSIDLPIDNDEVIALSNYAFVIPWAAEKKYVILYFSKSNFNKLLEEKEKRKSYFDYINAQEKKYRKFYFYFTYKDIENNPNHNKKPNGKEEVNDEKIVIQQVSFFSGIVSKLKNIFHIK
ncbi:hypothetical protein [Streptococcus salivarius]|jgi:hypothetical protein